MLKARVAEAELRFGDHGPGYIVRGPRTDVGYVVLPPGQDFPNHYHETIEETFYTIAGTVTLWLNGRERHELRAGDFVRCDPLDMHYFVNEGDASWHALFVKAPYAPKDGVTVPWKPGDPAPKKQRREHESESL